MKYLALGIALALSAAAFAYPTVLGPSGGFQVPTAEIQQGWAIAIDRTESTAPEVPNTVISFGLLENVEVGAQYVDFGGADQWSVNAKLALPIDLAGGAFAVGAIYADAGANNPFGVYAAGTFPVAEDFALTANVAHIDLDAGGDDDDITVAVAAEKAFDNAAVGAEVVTSLFNTDTYGNLYVKYALSDALKVRLAWTGIGNATGFNLGAAYFFGAE